MHGNDADKGYISVDELITRIARYHPEDDMERVRKAYDFAERAHAGQMRKSGDPYFSHPCAVAIILTDLMQDSTTIAGGLLHDAVEDVEGVTVELVEKEFGPEVATLVDGVTKMNRLDFSSRQEAQSATLRKMFLMMAKDIRVVFIKLADRLHNMRTLRYQKPERQKPIAQETLDIYAPLAHRLGMNTIKWELEDLSLRYLDPDAYYDLVQKVGMKREEREAFIKQVTDELQTRLNEENIKCEIEGRPKHFYSIYRKMRTQHKTFDQITDLIAIRVLVNTMADCYAVLGFVHQLWEPMPDRIKDYITQPKANFYQSLHTTVTFEKHTFEVQVRTFEMHRTAEYGIAAHWRYKEGRATGDEKMDQKLIWLRRLLDWQKDTKDNDDFSDALKQELFSDEIFVLTPKGRVISLPAGATPLDFAYSVHTEVGHRCIGAKVNDRLVPLTTALHNNEVVEIMTAPPGHKPSRDWLNVVKTTEAKTKIRSFLKREAREDNIIAGKDAMERESKRLGFALSHLTKSDYLEPLFKRYTAQTLDDLYAMVGYGAISTQQVINRLIDEYRKDHVNDVPIEAEKPGDTAKKPDRSYVSNGVIVKGETGMLVNLAHCCNPLPGDRIIGFISRGKGVTVHRSDCTFFKDPKLELERLIEVEWANQRGDGSYDVELRIVSMNVTGVLAELTNLFASNKISVSTFSGHPQKDGTFISNFTLEIRDTAQLETVLKELRKNQNVLDASRVRQ